MTSGIKTPSVPSPLVPVEICNRIISYIPIEATKTILSLLLVNKGFFKIVSKRLYRHIKFSSDRDRSPFYDLQPPVPKSSGSLQKFRTGSNKGNSGKSRKVRQLEAVEILEIDGGPEGPFMIKKVPPLPKLRTIIFNNNLIANIRVAYDYYSCPILTSLLPIKLIVLKGVRNKSVTIRIGEKRIEHLCLIYTAIEVNGRCVPSYPWYLNMHHPTRFLDIVLYTPTPHMSFSARIPPDWMEDAWKTILTRFWSKEWSEGDMPIVRFVNFHLAGDKYDKKALISKVDSATASYKRNCTTTPDHPQAYPTFLPPKFRILDFKEYLEELGEKTKNEVFTTEELRYW